MPQDLLRENPGPVTLLSPRPSLSLARILLQGLPAANLPQSRHNTDISPSGDASKDTAASKTLNLGSKNTLKSRGQPGGCGETLL